MGELHEAAEAGDVDRITELIEGGADPNALDDDGHTPLHLAAQGELGCVKALLQHGADVNKQSEENGLTPLFEAIKYGDYECVSALLDGGADKAIEDHDGQDALGLARASGDDEILGLLGGTQRAAAMGEKKRVAVNRRGSVAGEKPSHAREADPLPKFDKAPEQRKRIRANVSQSIIFAALDETTLGMVIDSMEEVRAAEGTELIRQGDDGDKFYLIEDGTVDVFVQPDEAKVGGEAAERGEKAATLGPGATFGEIALMYNTPRTAGVVAASAVAAWSCDRMVFKTLVMQRMIEKRQQSEELLRRMPLLDALEPSEIATIVDVVEFASFGAGEAIITQGDLDDRFFILAKGAAHASVLTPEGVRLDNLKVYGVHDYFGELALLRRKPRAASVIATEECECLVLRKAYFEANLKKVVAKMEELASGYEAARESAERSASRTALAAAQPEAAAAGGVDTEQLLALLPGVLRRLPKDEAPSPQDVATTLMLLETLLASLPAAPAAENSS